MRIEAMSMDSALQLAKAFPRAWITELSCVHFGATPEQLDPSEWTEAHFFNSTQELRFMPEQDGLVATLLSEDADDTVIDEIATLVLPSGAGKARIRKIIQTDRDGQAYIAAVRFVAQEENI